MKEGTRVRFNVDHLRSTGQYTGPEAPAHYGPFARGIVTRATDEDKPLPLVSVTWEDGKTTSVLPLNLEEIVR
jgi:hypothetical protein